MDLGIGNLKGLFDRTRKYQRSHRFDPIWLGVISIKLAEISLITPPVGLNVYVVRSASPIPLSLEDVFAGVAPFLLLDFITLGLLIAFPQIVLVLPNLMY